MSLHINAKKDEIADTILLPGDPLRAKHIAERYLENIHCYNEVRGMLGFTGSYKGKRLSVQGTGMGIPSFSIYINELFDFYGVTTAVRVGTCGSLQNDIHLRDIVIPMSASTDSSVNKIRFNGCDYSPTADYGLLSRAVDITVNKGITPKVGNIFASDEFYKDDKDWWKIFADYGVLAVEMETTALYTIAAKFKAKALTILTVSDSLVTGENISAEDRQLSFTDMMEIALETVSF